ncbi:bacillithiol biosynthesis cysteine-adding enzyme BshC [Salinimicrobium catena]|uniref:Putative cysteine ligase BshC n=1 Tax=Salinimicrobium catena TaxID=390640 RepID=A0A1H5NV95_9FLAO|nr:bacillithiol biosynthesis cysteine-adding enzyme BshC [Salinimicrobium catena]SDL60972.1 bacillithiol biosynthesis cysteine-adding enzyme BshC [Salinimicrobium catena]SEF05370.1 bacillithiol biosynthesis cysteine-adding enzyme BshC [Salinimicrobium catena]
MSTDTISYSDTNYFSSLITDYLAQKSTLKPFYSRFPEIGNFGQQLEEKKEFFNKNGKRETLVAVLKEQYEKVPASEATLKNIELLGKDNTFTVTTGHQLNLFTGPLYFLYKIVTTINLAQELKEKYPDHDFVPVYWMATEDHDFEEINFFNVHGKKFQWNLPAVEERGGAVGELPTAGLEDVFKLFSAEIGDTANARQLKEWFKKAYLEHDDLAAATRYLANELFGKYGLVILDGHNRKLKKQFVPHMQQELLEKSSCKASVSSAEALEKKGYSVQVNPREINLFYLEKGLRERIIEKDGNYFVHDQDITWSRQEILELLEREPKKFSPNVLMRPLYQEVVLPNLCYIGGGGELAYWFELKEYFEQQKVPFPILLLRNSVLIQTEKQDQKRRKLNISIPELFLKNHELINRKVRQISNIDIDLSPQKEHLVNQFQGLYEVAEKTDKSFLGAVKAQEVKQLKGLENLEKRLLKAQKKKLEDEVSRIAALQNELFPNKGLQERHQNFSEFYLEYGENLIPLLLKNLKPLELKFDILSL